METDFERIKCDVLVIGSGGAGSFAAISAHQQGADVLFADRGILGRSGATVTAGHTCCAALGSDDSPDLHFRDTVRGGYFVNNQRLVDVYTKEAPQRIMEIDQFGAEFMRQKDGKFWLVSPPGGHTVTRSVHHGFKTGMAIMRGFRNEIRRRKIRWRDNTLITNLLNNGNRVVGATGLDLLTGKLIVFEARATVLASGGYGYLWAPEATAPLEAAGEVLGMALWAGAELVDMEFVQFLPMQIGYKVKHINPTLANFPGWREEIRRHAKMVNSEGKEILHQYDPRGLYTTRDVRANAIYCERRERKKVYLDLTDVPWEIIEQEFGSRFKGSYLPMLAKEGFDLNKTPIEVSIGAHYCMGGIRINEKGETCVPGLFAAGEVTGGIDGANRLGGNALTEVMVMGHITGETASNYAASVGEANAGRDQIDSEARNAFEIIEKTSGSDLVSPVAVRRQLQQALWSHVCVRRTEKGLKEALQTIEKLREKTLPRLGLHSPAKVYNLEWVQTLQLPAQLDVAEAVVRAALARTESRGAHQRDDHPEQDDKNWVKNIVLKRAKAGFELNISPAVITKLPISEAFP